jgi:cell wall-associated NlpC family hydrolase
MNLLIDYAMRFVGKPYEWGGKTPVVGGYDCSGYASEILRFAGLIGNREILNSQQLYDRFSRTGTQCAVGSAGALAFYGESVTKINHVAFMVDRYRILEAGGGDSTTLTPEDADRRGAMVRGRLVDYRGKPVAIVKPRYATIGLI